MGCKQSVPATEQYAPPGKPILVQGKTMKEEEDDIRAAYDRSSVFAPDNRVSIFDNSSSLRQTTRSRRKRVSVFDAPDRKTRVSIITDFTSTVNASSELKDAVSERIASSDWATCLGKWKEVFKKHDADETGYMNVRELRVALSDVLSRDITFEQAQTIYEEFPTHRAGLLDISEFALMMTFVVEAIAVEKSRKSLLHSNASDYLLKQLQKAGDNEKEARQKLLDDVASKCHPFRNILQIQDFDYEGAEINVDKTISAHQDKDFEAAFAPSEMRCLALVSHNGMKATMKEFVLANKNVLKKFRLTGTNSTMTMLREVFKDETDEVVFGPACKSGPLGGDAELVALMCQGKLGGMLFFQDPMDTHPHRADIDCLVRQVHVHNSMMANTPCTALMMMNVFRSALQGKGKPELIPSFFFTLEGPSVAAYKAGQKKVIASHKEKKEEPPVKKEEEVVSC
jgi:methylglyoxal synthase